MTRAYYSSFLSDFQCLGDQCEDTCCKGWGMQLSACTVEKYKKEAPELLEAVSSGESEFIMKRDPQTDYCVKFDNGWCGIHASRGTEFLGDACHFFPRVTRAFGDKRTMTASLSCPEVVRLALLKAEAFTVYEEAIERVPDSLKDYLPEGLDEEKAWEVHRAFIEYGDHVDVSPERMVCVLRSVAESMQHVDVASWAMAVPFYLKNAPTSMPEAQPVLEDPFNLLNALQGLVGSASPSARSRLHETISDMAQALGVTLSWENLSIQTSDHSAAMYEAMHESWEKEWSISFAPLLRRWIQAQLSVSFFPFAGFGNTLADRMTTMGVRFATLKLALMSACVIKGSLIDDAQAVRVVQSLARFMDHLADPTLSMQIYMDTGWNRVARLRGLLGPNA